MKDLWSQIKRFFEKLAHESKTLWRNISLWARSVFASRRSQRHRTRRTVSSASVARQRIQTASEAAPVNRNRASRRLSAKERRFSLKTILASVKNAWTNAVNWITRRNKWVLSAICAGVVLVVAVPILAVSLAKTQPVSQSANPEGAATLSGEGASQKMVDEAVVGGSAADADGVATDAGADPNAGPEPLAATNQQADPAANVSGEDVVGPESLDSFDPNSIDANTISFDFGTTDPLVPYIQARLMELGYIDQDIPNDFYGQQVTTAMEHFQRKNGLEVTGDLDPASYLKLFAEDAAAYVVCEGDEGPDVEELQSRLYELGYISSVTGYFGPDTKAAVERFQEKNSLPIDGAVGSQTMELLQSADATANYLSYGDKSDEIKKFQERLQKLGYLTTTVDGSYGKDTVNAVKRFQGKNGLISDGYLGPTTRNLLMSSEAQANALGLGDSGSDVQNIQERLKELKYLSKTTGYFGSDTDSAVKEFQSRNGLTVDGKVGAQTIGKLLSNSAKAAKTTTSNKNTSNNNTSNSNKNTNTGGASPENTLTGTFSASVDSLLTVAKSRLGCRYVKGAKGPNTFDCSGFVYWCLNQIGVNQGYWTSGAWAKNTKYTKIGSMSEIQAGDIICFKGHVGIAMGGGQMIDAGSSAGGVRTTSLSQNYWQRTFICAYRVL